MKTALHRGGRRQQREAQDNALPFAYLGQKTAYSLPSADLLTQQAAWLAPARSRLLRELQIAGRRRVLDLGAGYGAVTAELARRSSGLTVALDPALSALRAFISPPEVAWIGRIGGVGEHLPFKTGAFDLVFTQMTLLWIPALVDALREIARVLMPGGALLCLEPDYEGMIEYPANVASRALWCNGLSRAGADPAVGRKLPGMLAQQGFTVQVSLFDTLFAPHPARFDFLRDLPLTPEEHTALEQIESEARVLTRPWAQVAHLPFFLIKGTR